MIRWASCFAEPISLLLLLLSGGTAIAASPWRLTRGPHFDVYSQAGDTATRSLLLEFERLRSFFIEHAAFDVGTLPPVRVIVFGSEKEYEPFRLSATADAYFAGTEGRNYIVMAFPTADHATIAAHEYAHLILHAGKGTLPAWLDEGFADFYSTLRARDQTMELGGDLPARTQVLTRRALMPVAELVSMPADSPRRQNRELAEVFYAESWALTEMLMRSAQYGPGFEQLLAAVRSGEPSVEALARVYGTPVDQITRDLQGWTRARRVTPMQFPAPDVQNTRFEATDIPSTEWRLLMGDVLLAAGELNRAAALYKGLQTDLPESAEIAGALGTIAIRRGDLRAARQEWKQAIDRGIANATLCYRYAVLAEEAGVGAEEVRPALARAIQLQPDFDDARYMLALLEKTSGNYAATVSNLKAMKRVSEGRAYAYWMAMADSLIELGVREEGKAAARKAGQFATNAEDRSHAAQLAFIADTDLAVQFARDAEGGAQMVTTRKPHQAQNWNPFLEAGDDLRRVQGMLREIDCSGDKTRFLIQSGGEVLKLLIADPTRVQMRNAPSDFVCGPQEATSVMVEYAAVPNADGLIRGIEFKPPAQALRSEP